MTNKELNKEIRELKGLIIKNLKKHYEINEEALLQTTAEDIKTMKELLEINNLEMIKIEDINKILEKSDKKLSF